jgi:o-succinylbenzoate---CoA ligase
MVVESWLGRAAALAPARIALETPRGSCTYAQLLAAARAEAVLLAERGVVPGARVAIALAPGIAFATTLHACLLLGAIAVPIDLRHSSAERRRIAAGAAVVVDRPLGDPPAAARVVNASDSGAARARAHARSTIFSRDDDGGHDLDATAVIVHTSGTTSLPKPVELTYGNFLWSALGSAVALGCDPEEERWLCALPLTHVGGLSILLRSVIYATTAVVHERFQTAQVLQALRGERITLVSVVATTLARLLDAGLEHPPHLRCALAGGGPIPAALLARAADAGVPVAQTYGLTETCSQVTTVPTAAIAAAPRPVDDLSRPPKPPGGVDRRSEVAAEVLLQTAGPPLFCTRVRIAADGEIEVAGPSVAASVLDADGWLRTGDLGSLDSNGWLRVTGRKADTIISGGENVAPAEVEAVLEAHVDVLEAAVLGEPDPQWGEAVAAIVVARPGAAPTGEQLRAHCAARLSAFKVPKRFELRGDPLPRTASGKLLRREFAAPASAPSTTTPAPAP